MDGRIFGLDLQLGFDAVLQAIAVLLLFLALSYILYEPVKKILKDRQEKIKNELAAAATDMEEAAKLRADYENKLKDINKEADQILAEARKKALKKEQEIIAEAQEEASRIVARANAEIELEKKKVKDEVKTEMIAIASAMAGKFVAETIDADKQDALITETLQEMGDQTWLS
ncbi:MAG: F0F1 ATP synthase subunit B [Lachnospiraceae bacterium]|nr:F0F1 ATP synthase subunit B [Lachnospiraceae bacterium]